MAGIDRPWWDERRGVEVVIRQRPAPGMDNEDFVVAGPHFAVVFDGATAVSVDTGCVHGVRWLVHGLAGERPAR